MNKVSLLQKGMPLSQAKHAVIVVHGRGSSGHDIIGLSEYFPHKEICWLAPSAEGGSWYPHRFLVPTADNEPYLSRALATVDAQVQAVLKAGIAVDNIVLAGFSQGACLVLEYVLEHPANYAFVAGLSGAVIGPLDRSRRTVRGLGTEILLGCAERDAHVPFEYVDHSSELLRQAGAKVDVQKFPGSAHTVFKEQLDWMTQRFDRLTAVGSQ